MWAVITGSSSGLGQALALELARRGYSILIHYRKNEQAAKAVERACQRYGVATKRVQVDFATQDGALHFAKCAMQHCQDIGVLINNLGSFFAKSLLETEAAIWDALFSVNVRAPFLLCQQLMGKLAASKGHIVMIGNWGVDAGKLFTKAPVYMLTKQALWGLTRSLAAEVAKLDVKVNMVSPAYLENSIVLPKDGSHRLIPLEEVVGAVCTLIDSSMTGQNLEMS